MFRRTTREHARPRSGGRIPESASDQAIARFASAALRAHDAGDVLVALADAAVIATGSDAGVVFTVRDDGLLAPVAAHGDLDPPATVPLSELGLPSAMCSEVAVGTLPIGSFTAQGFAAIAAVSIVATGAAPRVLSVFRAPAYADTDVEPLQLLAELAATALGRLRAETALRESEERLCDAQAIAHMGSYDWDIASDTNTWSDELYRIYGYEPQSFNASYERFLSFVHPDDREQVIATHQRAYAQGGGYSMRERIIRPDGSVRVLLTTGEVVMGPDGNPARMRGICWDVTDREAALENAQRSVGQVTELAETSPMPCLVIDDNGMVLHVNTAAIERLGWLPSATVGHSVTAILEGSGLPDTVGVPVTATVHTDGMVLRADVRSVVVDAGERKLVVVFVDAATVPDRRVVDVPAQSGSASPRRAGA